MSTKYNKELQLWDGLEGSFYEDICEEIQRDVNEMLHYVYEQVVMMRIVLDEAYSKDAYLNADPDPVGSWDMVMAYLSRSADQCMAEANGVVTVTQEEAESMSRRED